MDKSAAETLYSLIGCDPSASPEQICAEFRVRALALHPDKVFGEDIEASMETLERFQQLKYAKEVLCDEAKRRHYDLYLALGSALPLAEWMDNQERVQQTIHWGALKAQQQLTSAAGEEKSKLKAKTLLPPSSEPLSIRVRLDSEGSTGAGPSGGSSTAGSSPAPRGGDYPKSFESIGWTSHHTPTLSAFRSYKI